MFTKTAGSIMNEKKKFFSLPEAAAIMGISRIAVFKKVKKRQLPAIRIGRNWAIPAGAVQPPPDHRINELRSSDIQTVNPHPATPPSSLPIPRGHQQHPGKESGRIPGKTGSTPPPPATRLAPEKDPMDEMGWD